MRSVHVGVGHDDDLMVTELLDVDVFVPHSASEGGDETLDLQVGQNLIVCSLLDVESFPSREYRLKAAVPSLLGGATGALSLDDEDLALRWIPLLTVREFPGRLSPPLSSDFLLANSLA